MTLFDLEGSLSVNTSALERGLSEAEASAREFKTTLERNLDSSAESSEDAVEELGDSIGEELPDSVDKGSKSILGFTEILKADFVKGALSVAVSAVQQLSGAIVSLVSTSVSSYADYEQLVGGIETIFGDASDKVLAYADEAYAKAGMSVNTYLESVMSMGTSIIAGLKKQAVALSEEELAIRTQALDDQVEAEEDACDAIYTAKKKEYDKEYKTLKRSLDKEYDLRKTALDNVYKALEESLQDEIEAHEDAYNQRLSLAEKSYSADVEAYEKATNARISLINDEYLESIKLIDEEKYNRLKAIDDEIDALNAQTEVERRAIKKREQNEKRSALQKAIDEASTFEEREEAREALAEYNRQLAQEEREAQRAEQIEALKDQKDAINEEADAKKEAAAKTKDAQIEAVEEERENTLKAMRESYEAEKAVMEKAHDAEMEALEKAKSAQLSTLKASQTAELEVIKEAQEDQLNVEKEKHDKSLSDLKDVNTKRLNELKQQIKAEKVLLTSGLDTTGLSAEQLAEIYDQAVEIANTSLMDMSDIANKMGVNLESVMYAVTAMGRNNYTMLENLALGYAGSAEGAQQMLTQAEQIQAAHGNVVTYTLGNMADMLDALHTVVGEMGITGTTEKEASSTISGSLGQLQAAWGSFMAGLGRSDADVQTLTENLTSSLESYLNNLIPALDAVFEQLGGAFDALAPIIEEKLPPLMHDVGHFFAAIHMITSF